MAGYCLQKHQHRLLYSGRRTEHLPGHYLYAPTTGDRSYKTFLWLRIPRCNGHGAGRLGAGVWAPPFGRTAVWAPDVWAPALMREEIGFYRPIIISSIPFKLSDENDACFTVIEAGWTDINVFTYSSMKITRVSLQSKLDELIFFLYMYCSMKITRVSLQSKLDELLLFFHTYSSMKITRVSL